MDNKPDRSPSISAPPALPGMADEPQAGWSALLSGTNGLRSLVLAGGIALHAIDIYIATTILPSAVRDIGGLDLYAWNTTVFVVASIIGAALSTILLERVGPKAGYATAAVVFCIGGTVCAIAPSMVIMLVGRLLQGLGSGILLALAYALLRVGFPEPLWSRAMTLFAGMWGVAQMVGPTIGGVFAQWGIWRAAFWSLVPVGLLLAVLAVAILPRHNGEVAGRSHIAFPQMGLLAASVLAMSVAEASPDPARNAMGVILALALVALLVIVEKRSRHKLLPSDALRPHSKMFAIYAAVCLLGVTVTASEIFVPLFLQRLHHQTPLMTGYLAVLMAAGWTLGSFVTSGASGRAVQRVIMTAPLLQLAGMAILCALMPAGHYGESLVLVPICGALIATGFGVGLAWSHLLTRVLKVAPDGERALAGTSITTLELFATAMGSALAGMVANAGGLVDPGGVVGTAHAARWLFGVFCLPPLLCPIFIYRQRE